MQYRSKPTRPKAGETIPLVTVRTVVVKDDTPAANQPKHGKLDYMGGPKKKGKQLPKAGTRRIEKKSFSLGRYVGNGEQLTAFVMLDPEEAPQVKAANE